MGISPTRRRPGSGSGCSCPPQCSRGCITRLCPRSRSRSGSSPPLVRWCSPPRGSGRCDEDHRCGRPLLKLALSVAPCGRSVGPACSHPRGTVKPASGLTVFRPQSERRRRHSALPRNNWVGGTLGCAHPGRRLGWGGGSGGPECGIRVQSHSGPQQLQQVRESLAGLRPGGRAERVVSVEPAALTVSGQRSLARVITGGCRAARQRWRPRSSWARRCGDGRSLGSAWCVHEPSRPASAAVTRSRRVADLGCN